MGRAYTITYWICSSRCPITWMLIITFEFNIFAVYKLGSNLVYGIARITSMTLGICSNSWSITLLMVTFNFKIS